MLEFLYQDDQIVIVNKPCGQLVHRSAYAGPAESYTLQTLRDQIGQKVYPVHRLDRKTSGVLLFGLNGAIVRDLKQHWAETTKKYMAIVRGWTDDEIVIDYPLTNEKDVTQDAISTLKTIQRTEINLPLGKHATSRYSLVELEPKTGRLHQLRKHMNHIRHPIIGDRPHGCSKQNRFFLKHWNMPEMLLHARSVAFRHPISQIDMTIRAPYQASMMRMAEVLALTLK